MADVLDGIEADADLRDMMELSVAQKRRLRDLWMSFKDEGMRLLERDDVTDLMTGADGEMLIGVGDKVLEAGYRLSQEDIQRVIMNAAKLAGVHSDDGSVSVDLPTGERFESMGPPTVSEFMFSVRKPFRGKLTLEMYRDLGQISHKAYDALVEAAYGRKNFLIAGGAFVGKSSMLRAYLTLPCFLESRCFFIEQTPEIPRMDKRWVMTKTKPIGRYTATELVIKSLRHRVDRTFVGEIRGGEALDWLDTCNVGRPGGGATIHAPTASRALRRLDQLITRVTELPQRDTISETIDLIIMLSPHPDPRIGRYVSEIGKPGDYRNGKFEIEPVEI